jgi:hypothetical protein
VSDHLPTDGGAQFRKFWFGNWEHFSRSGTRASLSPPGGDPRGVHHVHHRRYVIVCARALIRPHLMTCNLLNPASPRRNQRVAEASSRMNGHRPSSQNRTIRRNLRSTRWSASRSAVNRFRTLSRFGRKPLPGSPAGINHFVQFPNLSQGKSCALKRFHQPDPADGRG